MRRDEGVAVVIAETSITIDGVTSVIDSGLVKVGSCCWRGRQLGVGRRVVVGCWVWFRSLGSRKGILRRLYAIT